MNKPSNKERDHAITKLWETVGALVSDNKDLHKGIQFSLDRLDHYIDWRRDGKRYRRFIDKQIAKQEERDAKLKSEAKTDGVQEAPTTIEEGVVE